MAELNKYRIMSSQFEVDTMQKDEVDVIEQFMRDFDTYDDVKMFITDLYGEVKGAHLYDYSQYNKEIYLLSEEDRIEICFLMNDKQYFSKGWKLQD